MTVGFGCGQVVQSKSTWAVIRLSWYTCENSRKNGLLTLECFQFLTDHISPIMINFPGHSSEFHCIEFVMVFLWYNTWYVVIFYSWLICYGVHSPSQRHILMNVLRSWFLNFLIQFNLHFTFKYKTCCFKVLYSLNRQTDINNKASVNDKILNPRQ